MPFDTHTMVLAFIIGVFGLIIVAGVRSQREWNSWTHVPGTIVESRLSQHSDEPAMDVRVRFTTTDGSTVTGWSIERIGTENPHKVGDAVEVAYDPANPEQFRARPV